MRNSILVAMGLFFLTLSMTCQKKTLPIDEGVPVSNDTVSYTPTDRNDISPPPTTPWRTLDTTNLDVCQKRLWDYLKTMYPIQRENYWNYDIYAIMDEPEGVFEHRKFVSRYLHFFIDTIYSIRGMLHDPAQPCANIDSTFFRQALGAPTCASYKPGNETTYFYYFKMRRRRGPCPYIFDEGNPLESRCYPLHFDYCALLMVKFSDQNEGKMHYISFYGPGG